MDKLRQRQEIQAFRIVKKHVKSIVNNIPFNNMGKFSYDALIRSNISERQIKDMFVEIYAVIGKPQYKRSQIKQKSELDFIGIISQFLSEFGGVKITSVHASLIESLISEISKGYENNISVAEITRNLRDKFGWYKYHALRIARTETTTATNYATVLASQNSEWQLEKQWISVQDARTRRMEVNHLHMNGVKVGEFEKFNVSGDMMDYPGDPTASAKQVINCRCKVVYLLKEDKDGLPIRKIVK